MLALRFPFRSKFWRRALWTLGGVLALAVVALAALVVLVDQPRVQSVLQRRLSGLANGQIAWDDLQLRLLPSPHARLVGARADFPDTATVRIAETELALRGWALLAGRVEIATFHVHAPSIRIELGGAGSKASAPASTPLDPRAVYREVLDALHRHAPESVIEVDDGTLEIARPDGPVARLTGISLRLRDDSEGVDVAASAASELWQRLSVSGRVLYADASAQASLELDGLKPQALLDKYLGASPVGLELPLAALKARARSDGRTLVEGEFELHVPDVALRRGERRLVVADAGLSGTVRADADHLLLRLGEVRLAPVLPAGKAEFDVQRESGKLQASVEIPRLDLVTLRDAALALYGDQRLVREYAPRLRAGVATGLRAQVNGESWKDLAAPTRLTASVELAEAEVVPPVLGQPVTGIAGRAELAGGELRVTGLQARLGASHVAEGGLRYSLKDGSLAGEGAFEIDMAQALELARQALPPERRASLASIESATGRLRGKASGKLAKGRWQAAAEIGSSDAGVRLAGLPGPLSLSAATLRADPDAVTVKGAELSFLDSRVVASASVAAYRSGSPTLNASVAEGVLGENAAALLLERTGTPPRLAPTTPLAFSAERVRWHAGALDVAARFQFPDGPRAELELGWQRGELDVPRLRIVDDRSDATFALQLREQTLIDASFRGKLRGATLEAMTKVKGIPKGYVAGNLHVTLDRRHPDQTEGEGRIEASAIDLSGVLGRPVRIEQLEFTSDRSSARLERAVLDLGGQKVTIRGDVRRSPEGPVVDAEIESDGLVLDPLLARPALSAPPVEGAAPNLARKPSAIWPLALSGRVYVRMDYLEYRGRRVAPVLVSLKLEHERANLDVAEAQVCGLEVPLQVEATPGRYNAAVQVHAAGQELDKIARCLSGSGVLITGALDLDAKLRTQGAPGELVKNLQGTVKLRAEKGRVHKFGLLANLLAYVKGAGVLEKDAPGLDREGFPYRELTVDAHIGAGKVQIDESAFRSDALGLVATGSIGIPDPKANLTVLVAPFGQVDKALGKIPILGYLTGGSIISLPVEVSGDIRDPLVVPLDPRAIASRVLGVFERTFKLPEHLLAPAGTDATPAGR
ncbi:MAG: AsmA-like C-terminal domain-containing protein [Burkholderiales bacterium]